MSSRRLISASVHSDDNSRSLPKRAKAQAASGVTLPTRGLCFISVRDRDKPAAVILAGMLTARMLNGMDYAIGCTIATRRADIDAIGGLQDI